MLKTLHFTTTIQAPRERVWQRMIAPRTYTEWTAPFHEGSNFEGSWDEGGRLHFMGPDRQSGMVAVVEEHRPREFICLRHIGMLKDGVEDLDSPEVRAWAGAHETYRFIDQDGGTEVQVSMDTMPDWETFMAEAWPKALAALKAVAERP